MTPDTETQTPRPSPSESFFQETLDSGAPETYAAATAGTPAPSRHLPNRAENGTGDPALLPHGCRCGQKWGGNRTCHCGACHLTFSGVSTFDLHRKGARCNVPADLGLKPVSGRAYECWGQPGEDQL